MKINYRLEWNKMTWRGRWDLVWHFIGLHPFDEDGWCYICVSTKGLD